MCSTVHLDTNEEGGHDIDILLKILGSGDLLLLKNLLLSSFSTTTNGAIRYPHLRPTPESYSYPHSQLKVITFNSVHLEWGSLIKWNLPSK